MSAAAYDSNCREAERMKARLAITGFEPSIQHIRAGGQGDFFRVGRALPAHPCNDGKATVSLRI